MRVLIGTTVSFPGVARMPRALSAAGWEVGVLCPQDSYIDASRYIDRRFHIQAPPVQRQMHRARRIQQQTGRGFLAALVRAVESWQPAIVVPGDEPTARLIHRVVQQATTGRVPAAVRAVLERSVGGMEQPGVLLNKRTTHDLAVSLGIDAPPQAPAASLAQALAAADAIGYPVVLKQAVSYSGNGVIVCRDSDSLRGSWRRSTALTANLHRRLENLARRGIGDTLGLAWHPTEQIFDIQQFVPGRLGMHHLACVQGRYLAGFSVVAEKVDPASGAGSVIRFVENSQMEDAASKLTSRCGYTGFAEFDFIVDETSGKSLLLECNPRPTPATHLGAYAGVDLCAALLAGLAGAPSEPPKMTRAGSLVALFPHEWKRDGLSPYLREAYHDVPWDEPELVRALSKSVQ